MPSQTTEPPAQSSIRNGESSNFPVFPQTAKGQKRPRDPNQLAKLIVDIAFGQVEDRETAQVKREKRERSAKTPCDLRAFFWERGKFTRFIGEVLVDTNLSKGDIWVF